MQGLFFSSSRFFNAKVLPTHHQISQPPRGDQGDSGRKMVVGNG
jgi:hypothetical protein